MNAGSLNRHITIKRLTSSKDRFGGESKDYTELYSTRASIRPITGSETFLNGLKNEMSHKIMIRVRKDKKVIPSDIIEYDGRVFDIQYVLNYEEADIDCLILVKEVL